MQKIPSCGWGKGLRDGSKEPKYMKRVWLVILSNGTNYPTTLGDYLGHPISWSEGILKIMSLILNSPIPKSHNLIVTR